MLGLRAKGAVGGLSSWQRGQGGDKGQCEKPGGCGRPAPSSFLHSASGWGPQAQLAEAFLPHSLSPVVWGQNPSLWSGFCSRAWSWPITHSGPWLGDLIKLLHRTPAPAIQQLRNSQLPEEGCQVQTQGTPGAPLLQADKGCHPASWAVTPQPLSPGSMHCPILLPGLH